MVVITCSKWSSPGPALRSFCMSTLLNHEHVGIAPQAKRSVKSFYNLQFPDDQDIPRENICQVTTNHNQSAMASHDPACPNLRVSGTEYLAASRRTNRVSTAALGGLFTEIKAPPRFMDKIPSCLKPGFQIFLSFLVRRIQGMAYHIRILMPSSEQWSP